MQRPQSTPPIVYGDTNARVTVAFPRSFPDLQGEADRAFPSFVGRHKLYHKGANLLKTPADMAKLHDNDVVVVDADQIKEIEKIITTQREHYVRHDLEKGMPRPREIAPEPVPFEGATCYHMDYIQHPLESNTRAKGTERPHESAGETGVSIYRSHYVPHEGATRRPASRGYLRRHPRVPFVGASRYATDFVQPRLTPRSAVSRPGAKHFEPQPFRGVSTYAADFLDRAPDPHMYHNPFDGLSNTEPVMFHGASEYTKEYVQLPVSRMRHIHLEPALPPRSNSRGGSRCGSRGGGSRCGSRGGGPIRTPRTSSAPAGPRRRPTPQQT